MKKAVVLVALLSACGLTSCCRVVDCSFEDPCASNTYSPSDEPKESGCKPCGGSESTAPRGCPAEGRCK